MMTGAKPVFVDIDPDTLNVDPARIEPALSDRTKAMLPVEVFGNPGGFDEIVRIAERCGLPVVEDCCEALGSALNGRKAGTFGTLSVFGFYPNKQITTGEGGMILTDNETLAEICVSLRNQGRGTAGRWLAHERLGYNFRLSDINCALGRVQLSRIDEIRARRRQVANWYREMLADEDRIVLPTVAPRCDVSWFVFVVRLADMFMREHRDAVLEEMTRQGIQVSNYFPPVHLQPFIVERYGYRAGDFPVAESAAARTIALPFHNHLTEAEVALVCGTLRAVLGTRLR
jgi:perosamine synthetase